MNEIDLRALQLTQQAVLRLINEVADRTVQKERARELMLAEEVAQAFRISKSRFYHVYEQIGLSPVKRFGRKLLFRRADVLKILEDKEPRRGRPPNRVKQVLVSAEPLIPAQTGL